MPISGPWIRSCRSSGPRPFWPASAPCDPPGRSAPWRSPAPSGPGPADQDPRLVLDPPPWDLVAGPPGPPARPGRDGRLVCRRRQSVLGGLALVVVRHREPAPRVLGYRRGPDDDPRRVFGPGLCRSRRPLALPLGLFRGDGAGGVARLGPDRVGARREGPPPGAVPPAPG